MERDEICYAKVGRSIQATLFVQGRRGIFAPLYAYTYGQPSGRESLVEQWILDKLNAAALELNSQLEARNFMLATTAAHNFWLYELCDVYIVSFLGMLGRLLMSVYRKP